VGIGTTTVPQSLYVAGTAEAQAFKLNQNAVAGYVLTSNSVGVGTWMAAGTLSSGSVNSGTVNQVARYAASAPTVSGSSLLFDDATNVGIGTSTPQAGLVVNNGNVGIGTWTASNSLIVRQGNVGIGTTTVPQSLYVAGTAEAQSFKMNSSPISGGVLVSNTVGVGTWMAISVVAPSTPPGGGLNAVEYNSPVGTFAGTENVFSFNGTNVGIGTTNGNVVLDVRSRANFTGNIGIGTTLATGLGIMSNNVGIGTWNPQASLVVATGNVGIGTTTVPQSLYVAGTAEAQSFKMNSSPISGGVLVSNTVGVGTWMALGAVAPSTPPGGGLNAVEYNSPVGTFAGTENVFSFNGTNVGIGTTNGNVVLDVRSRANFTGNIGIGTTLATGLGIMSNNVGIGTWNPQASLVVATGNVGIGTTTPQTLLSVVGGNVGIGTWTAPNNLSVFGRVGIGSTGPSGFVTTAAPNGGMIIEGNIGIGTTNPGQVLDLTGGVRTKGSSGGCLMIRDTDNNGWTRCTTLGGVLTCTVSSSGVCP